MSEPETETERCEGRPHHAQHLLRHLASAPSSLTLSSAALSIVAAAARIHRLPPALHALLPTRVPDVSALPTCAAMMDSLLWFRRLERIALVEVVALDHHMPHYGVPPFTAPKPTAPAQPPLIPLRGCSLPLYPVAADRAWPCWRPSVQESSRTTCVSTLPFHTPTLQPPSLSQPRSASSPVLPHFRPRPCSALGMFLLYSAYSRVGKINATVSTPHSPLTLRWWQSGRTMGAMCESSSSRSPPPLPSIPSPPPFVLLPLPLSPPPPLSRPACCT